MVVLMSENKFEEYLRSVCMPTQRIDNSNYKIIEIKNRDDVE